MIEIVDYEAGNLTSVKRALDYLGIESRITPDPGVIAKAARIIFPGVGRAGSSMETLKRRGLDEALRQAFAQGTPIMGICMGMQIIFSHSEEDDTDCLGLLKGGVKRFRLDNPALKVPHMGWNGIRIVRPHPLLEGVRPQDEFYFVHSFHAAPSDPDDVISTTEYEAPFTSAVGKRNLFATQFHPEKSGPVGLRIYERFARWEGESC